MVMSPHNWVTSIDGVMGGLPVIRGTRITVHSIDARVCGGDSLDDIARENPDIPREAFEAALRFARTHPIAPPRKHRAG